MDNENVTKAFIPRRMREEYKNLQFKSKTDHDAFWAAMDLIDEIDEREFKKNKKKLKIKKLIKKHAHKHC